MVKNAKEGKLFDEEEARRGISVSRRMLDEEAVEAVDEEGNVIAGEVIKTEVVAATDEGQTSPGTEKQAESTEAMPSEGPDIQPQHTLVLPARAPKQLLLDIKEILLSSPGPESVALSIGGQTVKLPITANMTPEILNKLEESIRSHSVA